MQMIIYNTVNMYENKDITIYYDNVYLWAINLEELGDIKWTKSYNV